MDTELARTFLTVVTAGNFINAADRLHVSQSTVSTRIHALEGQLGCTLFVRNKAGTTLTSAGRQFQRHAATLVRTIEQARHDIGIPEGFSGTLIIGGRIGLWEEFLVQWLQLMKEARPEISIRAESGLEPELMQSLVEGRMDIGVMYTPQSRPGLKVEQLFEEYSSWFQRIRMANLSPNLAMCTLTGGRSFTQDIVPAFHISVDHR
jgi:LysR family transcriptional regulator, flagellar master operon regulator